MNKRIYEGSKLSFRKRERIGCGGNSEVFRVEICKGKPGCKAVVAKFFTGDIERYKRFQREINILMDDVKEIEGILPILDMHRLEDSGTDDEAWYLMPEANKFEISKLYKLEDKLDLMLQLAKTIEELHRKGIAHRDIKPDNILIYKNRPVLSDYGLVWTLNGERITVPGERLGPYKIMPPELESYNGDLDLDYRASDVYLFSKVLWIVLREDDNGFRGYYNRRDSQIYLDHDLLGFDIPTLEPIHLLMERATEDEMNDRICISDCIEYIKRQIQIITKPAYVRDIDRLCFEERIHKAIAISKPEEIVITNRDAIFTTVDSLLPYGKTVIKSSVAGNTTEVPIGVSERLHGIDAFTFLTVLKEKPIQISMCVDKMIINIKREEIRLICEKQPDRNKFNGVSWREYRRNPINEATVVFLDVTEELIVTCVC